MLDPVGVPAPFGRYAGCKPHVFVRNADLVEVQQCLAVWWPRSDTCGIMNPCPRPVGIPAPFGRYAGRKPHVFVRNADLVEVQHCLAVWWPRSDTCGIMNPCPRPVGVPAPFGVCVVYPPSYGLVYMCIVRRVAMPVPRHISRPSPCFFIPFPLAFPVPIRYICPHRRDEPPHFLFY